MKNLPLFFCGAFATIAFSWSGLILSQQIQIGHLEPYVGHKGGDPNGDMIRYPEPTPKGGAASAGRDEYIRLGCLYCHSQQIRPATLFPKDQGDIARGWGPRETVARDYITQDRVLLGTMRTGPDLANVGARLAPDWHYLHFFDPAIISPGSNMAPFAFLYKRVELKEGQALPARAVNFRAGVAGNAVAAYRLAHPYVAKIASDLEKKDDAKIGAEAVTAYEKKRGYDATTQFVPTERLDNLIAYLMSLKIEGDLPEARIKD